MCSLRSVVLSILLVLIVGNGAGLISHSNNVKHQHSGLQDTVPIHDAAPQLIHKEWLLFFDDSSSCRHYTSIQHHKLAFPNLRAVMVDYMPDATAKNDITSIFSVNYRQYSLMDDGDDPIGSVRTPDDQGNAQTLNIQELYSMGYNGSGVVVGVIDTGIDDTHQDFEDPTKIVAMESFVNTTYGFSFDHNDPYDTNGHGTHVASTAVGNSPVASEKGIAYGAQLMIADIDNPSDPSGSTTDLAIIAAFEWLLGQGVDVINISYGGSDTPGDDPVEVAISRVVREGVLVVASAGNLGSDSYTQGSPSATDEAIAVAAIDDTGASIRVAGFSSRGPSLDRHMKPDIAAPGVQIRAAYATGAGGGYSAYTYKSGTSMASPQIAGAAAVLINALADNGRNWNPGALKAAMMKTGADVDDASYFDVGGGLGDINAAYLELTGVPTGTGNVPKVLFVSDVTLPFDDLQRNVYPGFQAEFLPMVVSSHPTDVTASVSGDATLFLTVESSWFNFSHSVQAVIDVPSEQPEGTLQSTISFHDGNQEMSLSIIVDVVHVETVVAVDCIHTDWSTDNVDSHSQYREVFQWGLDNGIGFVEVKEGPITPSLVSQYDIWWAPDPTNIDYPQNYAGDWTPDVQGEFTSSEIQTLKDWVDGGGNLLIDFNGRRIENVPGVGDIETGTCLSELNELLSEFGIVALDAVFDPGGGIATATKSSEVDHALLDGVEKIDHYGGVFASATGNAVPLLFQEDAAVVAAYECQLGGRAVFAHSNFPFDNYGFWDSYNVNTTNREFAENVFLWLSERDRLVADFSATIDTLAMEFKAFTDYAPNASLIVDATLISTNAVGEVEESPIDLTKQAAIHTATLSLSEDGHYNIIATVNDQLAIRYMHVRDAEPPAVVTNVFNGRSVFEGDLLQYNVSEQISGIASVALTISGEERELTIDQSSEKTLSCHYTVDPQIDQSGARMARFIATDGNGNSVVIEHSVAFFGSTSEVTTTTTGQGSTSTGSLSTNAGTTSGSPTSSNEHTTADNENTGSVMLLIETIVGSLIIACILSRHRKRRE